MRVEIGNLLGQTLAVRAPPFSLTALNLTVCTVTGADLVHLEAFPELRRLKLGYFRHRITDQGLVHLSGLHNLTHLDVSGLAVTDDGLRHGTWQQL